MAVEGIDAIERVCKALADRTRLRILGLLVGGEVCVCHIHESLGVPQPTASRHLAYLRRAGLVDARKQGLWVYYRLVKPEGELAQTMLAAAAHCVQHIPATFRDRGRLTKRVGERPADDLLSRPVLACCRDRPSSRG